MDINLILKVIFGILMSAGMYAYVNYSKAILNGEVFDDKKLRRTIGVAFFMGICFAIYAYVYDASMSDAEAAVTSLAGGMLTVIGDKLVAYIQDKIGGLGIAFPSKVKVKKVKVAKVEEEE